MVIAIVERSTSEELSFVRSELARRRVRLRKLERDVIDAAARVSDLEREVAEKEAAEAQQRAAAKTRQVDEHPRHAARQLLTIAQIAELLTISLSTAYRLIGTVELPAVRFSSASRSGRAIERVWSDDLDRFLAAKLVAGSEVPTPLSRNIQTGALLKPKQVADKLSISTETVYRIVGTAVLPAIRVCGIGKGERPMIRVWSVDIDQFLETKVVAFDPTNTSRASRTNGGQR